MSSVHEYSLRGQFWRFVIAVAKYNINVQTRLIHRLRRSERGELNYITWEVINNFPSKSAGKGDHRDYKRIEWPAKGTN